MAKYIKHTIIMESYPTHVYELIVDGLSVGEIEQQIPNLPQSKKGSRNECITHLYIEPQYRGKGYGRELVSYFEKKAKDKGCWWIEVNSSKSAQGFYRHLGFIKTPSGIFGKILRCIGVKGEYYKSI